MQKTFRILPIAAVAAAIIAVMFRVFQLLIAVNYSEMGFFSTEAGFFLSNGLYLLLAAAVIVFVIGAVFDKKHGAPAFSKASDTITSGNTAALGVAFLVGACLHFYELAFNFSGIDLSFIGEAVIFVLFALIGFMTLSGRRLKPIAGYLQIVICISYTLKAASLFMQNTIIVRVSDELILMLSYVCSVLFFLALGRFISSNESRLTRYKLTVFGAAAAMLSACASAAGYIALAIDPDYMGSHMGTHPLSETAVTVIAFTALAVLYGRKTAEGNQPDNENEEAQTDEKSEESL